MEEGEFRLKNVYLTLEASARLFKCATKNAAASASGSVTNKTDVIRPEILYLLPAWSGL
jgi:hypothetical protein